MKTVKATLEFDVPVAKCGRCSAEAAFHPHVKPSDREGLFYIQVMLPAGFSLFHLGQKTEILCPDCERFLHGAVEAMGIFGKPGAVT